MAARKKNSPQATKKDLVYLGGPIENQPVIYANNVEMSITPYDIQIRLNRIVSTDGNQVSVANQAILVMSPQHAESFHDVLGRAIKALRGVLTSASEAEKRDAR